MQVSANSSVDRLLAAQASAIQTGQQIDMAVAKKQLDAQKQAGDAAIQLLQQAVATSKAVSGTRVDVQA